MVMSSGADLLTTAVAFGTGLLVARTLGPYDRGVYTLVTTVGMLIAFTTGMGIFESLLSRNVTPSAGYHRTALATGVTGTLTMLLIAVIARQSYFLWYALFPLFWSLTQIYLARAALARDWSWVYLRVVPNAIQIMIVVALWLTGRLSVFAALVAMLAGQFVVLTMYRILRGKLPVRPTERISRTLRNGLPHHMLNLPRMANYRGPVLILGLVGSTRDVGLFAVASAVGSMVPTLTWSLMQNLLVLSSQGHRNAARARRVMILGGYLASIVTATLFLVIGEWTLRVLYGNAFAHTWPALVIVLAVQGMWLHSGLLEVQFRTAGVPQWAAAIEGLGIAVLIVVMLTTKSTGYMAAAYGTAATCLVTLLLCKLIVWRNPERFGHTNG